jgi:SAM-dependent methyltransferase
LAAENATFKLALGYDVELGLVPSRLADRFVQLELDDDTRQWIDRTSRAPPGSLRTIAQRALTHVLSDFDVNALLGLYPMHLLSTAQWRTLIGTGGRRLLDVGAGSGDVTTTLAPLFEQTTVTEISHFAAGRLERRGFRCLRIDLTRQAVPGAPYDVVSCLNVLDRCARPQTLLERARDTLVPGGHLLIALALPHNPFFYDGPRSLLPREQLALRAERWEEAAVELVERVIEPLGLKADAWTRSPYLSGGDGAEPFYELDDMVLMCRKPCGA